MAKVLNTRIQYKYDSPEKWESCSEAPLKGELLVHAEGTTIMLKTGDGVNTVNNLDFVLLDDPVQLIETKPSVDTSVSYVYNGLVREVPLLNYDETKMQLSGNWEANKAGTHTCYVTPRDGYAWNDGTTDRVELTWTIEKATPTLTLDKTSVNISGLSGFDVQSPYVTYNVSPASLRLIVQSLNPTICTGGYIEGNKQIIIVYGGTNGSGQIKVHTEETENYKSISKIITVTTNVTTVDTVLENNSWETISIVSKAGKGSNYWKIGDCKSVAVSGTIGTLSVSGTYYAYIIDFDHDYVSGDHTIEFGTFKTAASNGVSVALTDSLYGNESTSPLNKYFNMNHSSISATSISWKTCDLRYDVLGSTNSDEALTAPTNTASSPVSKTFMSALPSELRSYMRPISCIAMKAGSHGSTIVETCTDYLPLLSSKELGLGSSYAGTNEYNTCTIYKYYSDGNATLKYRHSSISSTCSYWTRSIYNTSRAYFVYASTSNKGMGARGQNMVYGIAPIFRV